MHLRTASYKALPHQRLGLRWGQHHEVPTRDELAIHSTVKPVALVADAIKDVSKRKAVVLNLFGGSGTTIIAAEKTGRRARAIELAPKYVDVAVRRWERYTGKTAVLDGTGQTFEDVEVARMAANDSAMATEEVA